MHLRRLIAVAVPLALALTACSSSGGGTAKKTTSTTPTTAAARAKPADTGALVTQLEAGIGTPTTAHFTINASIAGQAVTGTGDQKLTKGTLDALAATATLPGGLGDVQLVVTGGKTYAKLPKGLATGTKPWALVTADSKNPIVAQLGSFIDTALTAASLGNLGGVVAAAESVTDLGTETIDGTGTTHYKVVVDPAKLPASITAKAGLGTAPIPADLYLDKAGRPIKIQVALSIGGQRTTTTIGFGRFGDPVTITAPPADQVATS